MKNSVSSSSIELRKKHAYNSNVVAFAKENNIHSFKLAKLEYNKRVSIYNKKIKDANL